MGKRIILIGIIIFVLGIILALYGIYTFVESEVSKKITLKSNESINLDIYKSESIVVFFTVNCTRGKIALELMAPNGTSLNRTIMERGENWNYTLKSGRGKYVIRIENLDTDTSTIEYSTYRINNFSMYMVLLGIIFSIVSSMVMMIGVFLVYRKYRYGGARR